MKLNTSVIHKTLHFRMPATTSRGTYVTRKVWYILLSCKDSTRKGIGECAPLPQLSCDDVDNYESVLLDAVSAFENSHKINFDLLQNYPSIVFGLETAWQSFSSNSLKLWDTPFSCGTKGIPINGLIWMGNYDYMFKQIETKLEQGFDCIKIKIGAIKFDKELKLLDYIRKYFKPEVVTIRLDANGAFKPQDAPYKLNELSDFHIHSIEQPIAKGQWEKMRVLCESGPIAIALDEELIGINNTKDKRKLLKTIKPSFIVLKPSLHGGIKGGEEWISLAREENIDYWITSALESNIGLNAISQWCATLNPKIHQGLGTGLLFHDNTDIGLHIEKAKLHFSPDYITNETLFNNILNEAF